MPNETGLNLTIAKYLTPKGKDINKLGINPDVNLPLSAENILDKKDIQMEAAKTMMEQMISSNNP